MKHKEYALYKGEEILAVGTIKEISEMTGVKKETIKCYGTPSYQNRLKRGNSRKLISLEDEDVETKKFCTSCNQKFPATAEYFLKKSDFNGGFNDGLQSVCFACRNKKKIKKPSKKIVLENSIDRFEVGKKYQIKVVDKGKLKNYFEGEIIQITKNHITFKSEKHGYCESFKEIDFKTDYSIQEVG